MISFRTTACALAALLTLGAASAASATTLIITDVQTGNGNLGNVSVPGFGNPWTTPIILTDSHGQTYVVFCDDLNHDVNVGGGQSLGYHTGLVMYDGAGNPLTEAVSNEMGQLADVGKFDYAHGNENGAIAAQAAIWGLEYGVNVTSSDPTIQGLITQFLTVQDNGRGWASGLIADGFPGQATQSFVTGGVPEPSTWAMLILGFLGLGAVLRDKRRASVTAA